MQNIWILIHQELYIKKNKKKVAKKSITDNAVSSIEYNCRNVHAMLESQPLLLLFMYYA